MEILARTNNFGKKRICYTMTLDEYNNNKNFLKICSFEDNETKYVVVNRKAEEDKLFLMIIKDKNVFCIELDFLISSRFFKNHFIRVLWFFDIDIDNIDDKNHQKINEHLKDITYNYFFKNSDIIIYDNLIKKILQQKIEHKRLFHDSLCFIDSSPPMKIRNID